MNKKEIEDALHTLLHCSLKDTEYETQVEQYKIVRKYITNLQQENQKYKEVIDKATEWVRDWTHDTNDWFEEDSKPSELLDILNEVSE